MARGCFRTIILALCLVSALGACSPKPATKAAGGAPSAPVAPTSGKANETVGPAGPGPRVDVTASPTSQVYASVNVSPPAKPKGKPCPTQPPKGYDKPIPDTGTYVRALIAKDRTWGKNCDFLTPGHECWMPYYGSWRIEGSTQGSIVFQVFEDGGTKPVRSPEVGPIPNTGSFNQSVKLKYIPSKTAKIATFRVLLKDALGQVVATSEPESFSLPVCQAYFAS